MNQKKTFIIFYLAVAAVIIMALPSCKKFLDRPPAGRIIEDSALTATEDLDALLNGAFVSLGGEQFYGGRLIILSELLADQLNGSLLTEDYGEIYNRRTSIFGAYKNDFYTNNFQVVTRANKVLEFIDLATGADKDRIEGTAKFLRGVVHFELVRMFAQPYGFTADNGHPGIPIRLTASLSPANRATVSQVYTQVISDLSDAEAKLPATNGNYPSKAAARAYLAKVYFQMNNFQQAFNYANLVLDAASASTYQFNTAEGEFALRYSLAGSKESIFKIVNQQNIFEPGSGLRDNFRSDTRRPTLFFTDDIFNRFQNTGDKRAAWLSNTLQAGINTTTKFNLDRFELPVITVTEIKLIRAEAAGELGGANLAKGIQDVNDVLTRAFGNTSQNLAGNSLGSELIAAARNQRLLEFVGEGKRLQEIKRIGVRNKTNIDRRGASWNCPGLILQFPQGEMASNTSFERNPEGGCN